MKTTYEKPELETKAYAQFESVFTSCSKTSAPLKALQCSLSDLTESGKEGGIPSDFCHKNENGGS